ncbi:hypothetical protein A2715_02740 [Candidatus Woesebacteria bacterium RIFCSPHIGHO2_01_FULL_39_32]|uniref:Uncharacterized protein n=1 Tax=Candidatus Woesebacteria bacterium RIFCSPLOWO2_01_FULL_39_25 TaxID=1802521 RepID=A0A1F8BK16_9BACT|nr:MAG: hypothetical protein A2124_01140 [Candidatus Woesebacteria bacterium GWB1_37_5]OGM24071.1 MAG: hypothetical protein A2715_02740 [Candidatus Woesebacteria bacterium RIFCSPHIGHO2_01_FULL_39_32]OGM37950.1 MAG: hypothetical protein A3F01_03020 [Candidatus Woesebacteria bacterium RIFCSPHIGHO2_12_FULL_38_11]OGM64414.1 MAG: hypothetical protein A2893_00915 [Candidatus Woesebacteria bacterium RIFCSPLOWO2_01_FULL_39_25]
MVVEIDYDPNALIILGEETDERTPAGDLIISTIGQREVVTPEASRLKDAPKPKWLQSSGQVIPTSVPPELPPDKGL